MGAKCSTQAKTHTVKDVFAKAPDSKARSDERLLDDGLSDSTTAQIADKAISSVTDKDATRATKIRDCPNSLSSLLLTVQSQQYKSLASFDLVASNSFVCDNVKAVMGSSSDEKRENILSKGSSLASSYCIGLPGERFCGECSETDKIEAQAKQQLCQIYGAEFCEVQLSGMLANIAAYHALLPDQGCTVMASPTRHGGHYSHNAGGPLTKFFGASVVMTPWDPKTDNIDLVALPEAMALHKPSLLIIGWSETLFEQDLQAIREVCENYRCKVMYDMSHVARLVVGGVFQPDMMQYADIVTSSTGKSLHSADHGIVLWNDPNLTHKIHEAAMPILTSNAHFQETAALPDTLLEMRAFSTEYARQDVANTAALAQELSKRRFTVLCESSGYSKSHEIVVSLTVQGKLLMTGPEATELLDSAGIFANLQELPDDTPTTGATGLRLGTQVLTRRGFRENDMVHVADALEAVLTKKKTAGEVSENVARVCSRFDQVHFASPKETIPLSC